MLKKGLLNIILTSMIIVLTAGFGVTQNGIISIASVEGCNGDYIEIPVMVTDFFNIGAITLFIDYNPQVIEFDTLTDINPSLTGLIFNDIEQLPGTYPGGKIGISWSGFNPVNIVSDNIFILSFLYLGQNDSIVFSSNNEIADFEANILPMNYVGATISYLEEISITQQPENLSLYNDETGDFTVEGVNINEFEWEYLLVGSSQWISVSGDNTFSGQNTNSLHVSTPDIVFNETYFRCNIYGCNNLYSDSVSLFVEPNTIQTNYSQKLLSVFPNPASDYINISVDTPGLYKVSIYNSLTKRSNILINDIVVEAEQNISINTSDLSSGIYFIILSSVKENYYYRLEKKIIIHK